MNNSIGKLVLAGVGLALLTSCGAKTTILNPKDTKVSTTDLSSHDVGDAMPAECNYFSLTGTRFFGKLAAYRNANNVVLEDLMRVRLEGVPDDMSSNPNVRIRFYRARADELGTVEVDPAPLAFRVEQKLGAVVRTLKSGLDKINNADIAAIKTSAGITAADPSAFFQQVELVISNVDYTWDFLKIAIYKDGTLLKEANVLMPIFAANPNVYGSNHPQVLQTLHPFFSEKGSSKTDSQYADQAKGYCF